MACLKDVRFFSLRREGKPGRPFETRPVFLFFFQAACHVLTAARLTRNLLAMSVCRTPFLKSFPALFRTSSRFWRVRVDWFMLPVYQGSKRLLIYVGKVSSFEKAVKFCVGVALQ